MPVTLAAFGAISLSVGGEISPESSTAVECRRELDFAAEVDCRVDLEREGGGPMPKSVNPRDVLGRDFDSRFPSLSEPEDFEAFSNGSLSEAFRADLERERPSGRFLTAGESSPSREFESFLDDFLAGVEPQNPQEDDC